MTTDKEHLQWIFNRLINVHKENANYDYMQRLQKIIETTNPVNVALVDVSGAVCGNCRTWEQGTNPDMYCLECKRMVEF